MDGLIQISKINDFIFCPISLYVHNIYENFNQSIYHNTPQTSGKITHENIDSHKYSTSKRYFQGTPIYSQKYKLVGKIDLYDYKTKSLIDRKYKIKKIYSGYIYQLYAQYFCLIEKGYKVNHLYLHSLSDNKRYEIPLPDKITETDFNLLINKIRNFSIGNQNINVNRKKCSQCIYSTLCSYSPC